MVNEAAKRVCLDYLKLMESSEFVCVRWRPMNACLVVSPRTFLAPGRAR